jgi:predicted DNA-binding antitoxin AbrB/MazE fold protein
MSTIRVVQLSSYTSPEIKEVANQSWIDYGDDNNYFQYLIDRYNGSPTNNAVINGIVELMYGLGLDATDASMKPDQYAQMRALFDKKTLRKMVSDYKMMGQCAVQVVYNQTHDMIVDVEHLPVETLRAEKCDSENGEIYAYYYAKSWVDVVEKKEIPQRISAFGMSNDAVEILYIKPYRAGYYYYAPVDYQGGLQYAELEEEIANFHLNNIKNGLMPSMMINFNNGIPDEQERSVIEARIADKFSGSSNAGRFILAFNDNKDLAATIEPVQINDAHAQYEFLANECTQKIMISHRVTSPMLLGIKDNSGLGNNADELKTASALYENTVINPSQEVVLDGISEILAFNDISLDIYFKTLQPVQFGEEVKVITDTEAEKKRGFSSDIPELEDELGEKLAEILTERGEVIDEEEWELVDERPVDYEMESQYDALWTFARVIKSDPFKESPEQDTSLIKVRYVYKQLSASLRTNKGSRPFCKMMMDAGKVYRKEDIDAAQGANAGFGPNGSRTYDIFLYKGGPWCRHIWERRTYLRKNNKHITVNEARKLINALDPEERKDARLPVNDRLVSTPPREMDNNGYLNPPK